MCAVKGPSSRSMDRRGKRGEGRPWCPVRDDSGRGNGEAGELRIVFWRQGENDSQQRTSALVQQPFPSRGGGSPDRGRGCGSGAWSGGSRTHVPAWAPPP